MHYKVRSMFSLSVFRMIENLFVGPAVMSAVRNNINKLKINDIYKFCKEA